MTASASSIQALASTRKTKTTTTVEEWDSVNGKWVFVTRTVSETEEPPDPLPLNPYPGDGYRSPWIYPQPKPYWGIPPTPQIWC